jgi:hypothetical protein
VTFAEGRSKPHDARQSFADVVRGRFAAFKKKTRARERCRSAGPIAQGPLPLVIGITGHRDLHEVDCKGLEAQVRGTFAEIRERYSYTPLLLLSALLNFA